MADRSLPPSDKKPPKRKYIRPSRRVLAQAEVLPKPGALSSTEKSIIDSIVASNNEIVPSQIDATGIALRKDPATIARYVLAAKEKFAENASKYVDIHRQVMEKALASDNPKAWDTARKAGEFGMTNISAKDRDGKSIRIVDSVESSSSAPQIRIGIALGGLPSVSVHNDDDE
jgi:hypothetical protein